jgi:hypothetical protein
MAALFCEGREDACFLERVLTRQLGAFGMKGDGFDFDVVSAQECRTVESAERVRDAVRAAAQHYNVVFLHQDRNEREKIDSLRNRIHGDLPSQTRTVAVVPVRETEAWALADPAVFAAFRGSAADVLPSRPRDVEAVQDPKAQLSRALGRRYDERIAESVGERIDLGRLAQVPAYAVFLQELTNALKELRFL